MTAPVTVIGAGLAGCEAAWQIVRQDLPVRLYEMRPSVMTPAHSGGNFAELICSNSLRGAALSNAVGLLKEELRRLGSLLIEAADATAVPAGGALAVDRQLFSAYIEDKLRNHPLVEIVPAEVQAIPEGVVVIAAGPLASPVLSEAIAALTGAEQLFFHDAIAPIVSADSIDMDKAFFASRYGKGDGADYLNCPFTKDEYLAFYEALKSAELYPLKNFEEEKLFSGCMPIEALSKLGEDTMRFGPLKPVGLELPGGGEAYAVVQLRREDKAGSMYNLVGFQTRLKRGEQGRVFRMIPGLEQADFLRFGQMHRNTYLNSPKLLDADLCLRREPRVLFAGQITGVEGYVESMAAGLVAGINAVRRVRGEDTLVFPKETAVGGLLRYISTDQGVALEPMNVNFGLLPSLGKKIRDKQEKNRLIAERALSSLAEVMENHAPWTS